MHLVFNKTLRENTFYINCIHFRNTPAMLQSNNNDLGKTFKTWSTKFNVMPNTWNMPRVENIGPFCNIAESLIEQFVWWTLLHQFNQSMVCKLTLSRVMLHCLCDCLLYSCLFVLSARVHRLCVLYCNGISQIKSINVYNLKMETI